jgi:hypothetical protein
VQRVTRQTIACRLRRIGRHAQGYDKENALWKLHHGAFASLLPDPA